MSNTHCLVLGDNFQRTTTGFLWGGGALIYKAAGCFSVKEKKSSTVCIWRRLIHASERPNPRRQWFLVNIRSCKLGCNYLRNCDKIQKEDQIPVGLIAVCRKGEKTVPVEISCLSTEALMFSPFSCLLPPIPDTAWSICSICSFSAKMSWHSGSSMNRWRPRVAS